ncbi:unnamed protein product [Paramecium sonneborni]|uniref:Uncharacterized protein n=1 Tax=Paramecium sonneborni TaxID=65129 RepID=A0A8S1MBG2_9CILI|nr:unnamed protein product [Paramecium sonneborni]
MSSQKRESKSPLKSLLSVFQGGGGGATKVILPPNTQIVFNKEKGVYEYPGKETYSEKKPEPKIEDQIPPGEMKEYLKPQNPHLRGKQQRQQKDHVNKQVPPVAIPSLSNNNQPQPQQQIQQEPQKQQEKQIGQEQSLGQKELTQQQITNPNPQIAVTQSIQNQESNSSEIPQQNQHNKQLILLQQQVLQLATDNQELQSQLQELCKGYNQLVLNYDSCNNFIQTLPKALLPQNYLDSLEQNLKYFKLFQPQNINLDIQQFNFNLLKNQTHVFIPPQIIDFPISSNEYLTQIIQEQNEELSDMTELLEQQQQEIQSKDLYVQQQQLLINDLLRKLEEFVNSTNAFKKQLEGQSEEKKNYQQHIKQLDFNIKQQDLQIKNLQKEKEVYKRQVQSLQRDKDMYIKYNEELRRQYDEDIQIMNSQIEQSQLLINDQECIELRQIKDQLQFDFELAKSEIQNLKQLLHDISSEIHFGFKFLGSIEIRQIETKLDIQTLCHQYRREYQKLILQKEQSHLSILQDYKAQIFQINLQKSSLESIVAQQEKQINNYINDVLSSKKEISLICQEYDQKIAEINEQKFIVLNELKQCEDQLFQINLQLINQKQEFQSQLRNQILEQSEQTTDLEKSLQQSKIECEFLKKQIHDKEKEIEKYSLNSKELQEQSIRLEQEKKTIQHSLQNSEKLVELEKQQLDQLRYQSEQKMLELQTQIEQLTEQLTQQMCLNQELQLDNQNLNEQIEKYIKLGQEYEFIKLQQDEQNQTIQSLQNQIYQYEVQLEKVQYQYDELIIVHENFTNENKKLQQDIQWSNNQISDLEDQIQQLKETQQQYENKITELSEQIEEQSKNQLQQNLQQSLEEELNSKINLINQQSLQIDELSDNLQQLNNKTSLEITEMQQQHIKDINEKNDIISQLESSLQNLLNQNQLSNDEFLNLQQQSENQIKSLQQESENENNQLKLEIKQYQEKQIMLDNQIDQLNQQVEFYSNQNQQLAQQIEEIQNKQPEQQIQQQASNEVDEQEYQILEQYNLDLQKQIEKLDEELRNIEQENEELKSQHEKALNIIAQLRSKEHDVSQLMQSHNQYQSLQEENNNLKQLYTQKLKQIEQQNKQIQDQEQQLNNYIQNEQEYQKLKIKFQELNIEKNQLQQQIEKQQQTSSKIEDTKEFIVEQNLKLQRMEQEISSLNSKILQLTAQRDEFKEQLEFKQKNISQQKPSGFVGKLAGFFATESELKKLTQG